MTFTGHDLSVCVPYAPDPPRPDPQLPSGHHLQSEGVSRDVIWRWLERRYHALLPHAELVTGDTPPPFNRAAARNRAVENSTQDIILLADADVIFHVPQIAEAVTRVRHGDAEWVLCFSRYIQLLPETTVQIVSRQHPWEDTPTPARVGWNTDTGVEGLVVLSREAWEKVGGMDERCRAWGYDGWCLSRALETLCHPAVRTPGHALHLHHPRDRNRKQGIALNQPVYDRYLAAVDDPVAMAEVVANPARRG